MYMFTFHVQAHVHTYTYTLVHVHGHLVAVCQPTSKANKKNPQETHAGVQAQRDTSCTQCLCQTRSTHRETSSSSSLHGRRAPRPLHLADWSAPGLAFWRLDAQRNLVLPSGDVICIISNVVQMCGGSADGDQAISVSCCVLFAWL